MVESDGIDDRRLAVLGGISLNILHEIERAEAKHGMLPTDYCRAQTIASEEMGEVAEASLEMSRPFIHAQSIGRSQDAVDGENEMRAIRRAHLRKEWIQLAAVCVCAVENLDKEKD